MWSLLMRRHIEDPLERLNKKMSKSTLKFSLKKVNENDISLALKKIKKKKSAGHDGLTQEQMVNGSDVLT